MIQVKKLLAVILGTMLLCSACSGGSGDATPIGSEESAVSGDGSEVPSISAGTTWEGIANAEGLSGTVSYMHFGDDYERQMHENMFKAYMELVPDVKVEQMFTPGDDYYTKLQTLGASNTLPDIFWVNEARMSEFAQAGLLTDLAPYLETYPAIMEDMIDGLKPYADYEGVTYAIPKDWTSYVMYINKEIFAENGVDIPTSDWTMEDYRKIAGQLTKTEGERTVYYGTAVNNYRADWINFMGNYSAPWFQDGKANISDPLSVQGLSVPYNIIQDGSAPSPGSVSSTGDTEDRLFIIGKVAMYPSGRWVVPSFRTECDFEWTAVEMPKGDTRCTPFICGQIAIGESGQNKDAAANLISYQLSDEGMLHVMESALSMPPYKHLVDDPDYVNTPPEADAFIATSTYIGNESQNEILKTGKWAQFNDLMRAELSLAFEGEQTIEEAAANIDTKANNEIFK